MYRILYKYPTYSHTLIETRIFHNANASSSDSDPIESVTVRNDIWCQKTSKGENRIATSTVHMPQLTSWLYAVRRAAIKDRQIFTIHKAATFNRNV